MKTKSIRKLKAKAWVVFSKHIRARDCLLTTGSIEYGECFTCNETLPFKALQAGHFIPGRHNANLFSERGVHAQCRRCNLLESGKQLEYRRQVIKLYGEGADLELEEEARQIRKFTVPELEGMIEVYKNKFEELSG